MMTFSGPSVDMEIMRRQIEILGFSALPLDVRWVSAIAITPSGITAQTVQLSQGLPSTAGMTRLG